MSTRTVPLVSSDEQLFEKIKENDYQAYAQLFQRYQQPLLHFTAGYVQDEFYRQEIVQELLVQLWVKRDRIRIRRSFSSYLYKSIRNRIFNHFRDQSRYRKYFSPADLPEIYADDDIQKSMDSAELKKHIAVLLNSIPLKYREVYLLRMEQRLPVKNIAHLLGRSIHTVDKQVRKVVCLLKGGLMGDLPLGK